MTAATVDASRFVRTQIIVSLLLNGLLSAVFYFIIFGTAATVSVGPPDNFGTDYLIQGAIVGLASALPPTLLARAARGKAGLAGPQVPRILLLALLGILTGLLVGAAAWGLLAVTGTTALPMAAALASKVAVGLVITLLVTPRTAGIAISG